MEINLFNAVRVNALVDGEVVGPLCLTYDQVDTDFALNEGLFTDDFMSDHMLANGRVGVEDFQEFAQRIVISERRIDPLPAPFVERQPFVEGLIHRSFLGEPTKKDCWQYYQTKRDQLDVASTTI